MKNSEDQLHRKIVRNVAPNFRKKRIGPLIEMIETCFAKQKEVKVIDIGGTSTFWEIVPDGFLERCNTKVTIVNLPGVEVPRTDGRFVFENGDGCCLEQFEDSQFDIVFSNSVIEHVGGWSQMQAFAREVRRLAPSYFVQTPNFWFPVEPHCMTPIFHWLPFATRVWLLLNFDFGHWRGRRSVDSAVTTVESAKLLNSKMMNALFPDAELFKERLLLLPKSLMSIKR